VATAVLLLVHTPPETVSVSGLKLPWQKVVVPLILPALGVVPVVMVVVAVALPQELATV
jgi:hypothetical protein